MLMLKTVVKTLVFVYLNQISLFDDFSGEHGVIKLYNCYLKIRRVVTSIFIYN